MTLNKKKYKRNAMIWTVFAIAYCFVTRLVDVGIAGETQTEVGCVTINGKLYELLGSFNPMAYKISEILGYLMILICAIYGLIGLVQWIKRKNMLKVDAEILCTGVLFSVTIGLYVLFNKVAITYRPIIVPGEDALEASFPSSHSTLAIVVMLATVNLANKYMSKKILVGESTSSKGNKASILYIVKIIAYALALALPIIRFESGVHWITDIIAGIFIACALIAWYKVALETFSNETVALKEVNSRGGKHFKK